MVGNLELKGMQPSSGKKKQKQKQTKIVMQTPCKD